MTPPTVKSRNRKWPQIVFVGLVIAAVAFLSFVVISAQSFQDCTCAAQKNNAAKTVNEKQAGLVIYLTCIGTFLDAHNGAVGALAGLLVAVFTGTLWWATKQLQHASIEQSYDMQRSIAESARAATAMEEVAKHFADNVASFRERSSNR
jgi:hypothetical protein